MKHKKENKKPIKDSIAWAAGVLEGEGCFGLYRAGKILVCTGERKRSTHRVSCQMTDRDIVERVANVFKVGTITTYAMQPPYKRRWIWTASTAQARKVMQRVLPYMGKRRTAKIQSLLALKPKPRRK